MKKYLLLFAVLLSFGAYNAYAQGPFYCPATQIGACTRWDDYWIYNVDILMDDGFICKADVKYCRKCCYGKAEYYFAYIKFKDESCRLAHPLTLTSSTFHLQLLKLFFWADPFFCDLNEQIPPCPNQSVLMMTLNLAPCYRWGIPTYNVTTGLYETGLEACINEVGCYKNYTLCFNGYSIEYTPLSSGYSAICPTSPGYQSCFSLCE